MGSGISPWDAPAKIAVHNDRSLITLPTFYCPSRRPNAVLGPPYATGMQRNYGSSKYALTDYAANAGTESSHRIPGGPATLEEGDSSTNWQLITEGSSAHLPIEKWDGIVCQRSRFKISEVSDGTSKTYMVGEKYVNPRYYSAERAGATYLYGDNSPMYVGFNDVNCRWTSLDDAPAQDDLELYSYHRFGSVHAGSFHMAFCDASVRAVSYEIDPRVHWCLGNRRDGETINMSELNR